MKPDRSSHSAYFARYIDLVETNDLISALEASTVHRDAFWNQISEERSRFRYAQGKWSIKELLQHIIDCERIFCYRALCFARNETIPLPGFDENEYVRSSSADERTFKSLVEELEAVRESSIVLFKSLTDLQLDIPGNANGSAMTARAAGFIIVGHEIHHANVIKERYLAS